MKKVFVLLVCLTMCGATLFAQTSASEADFTTKAEGSGVVITKYKGKGGEVVIPATIGGKAVVGIGKKAFENSSLTTVTIPTGVTTIDEEAFSKCNRMKSITMPDSITTIGKWAFSNCSRMESITLPVGVTSIDEQAFFWCTSLKAINVAAANQQYRDIDGVLFTKDGKTLYSYPMGRKTAYTIPAGVTVIGEWAFSYCGNLTSVTIPDSVASIGEFAFLRCSSLVSVTIPVGVTSIGENAFNECASLVAITVSTSNRNYKDIDGVVFTKDGKRLVVYPGGGRTAYTIPAGVTAIGEKAFYKCTGLISVTISEGVTVIGQEAFSRCSSLTTVTIPPGVTTIGMGAFSGCSSLTSVKIPDSVTAIGAAAFSGCDKLDKAARDVIAKFEYETKPDGKGVVITKYIGNIIETKTEITDDGSRRTATTTISTWPIETLTIPETIGGKPVTGIGGDAFRGCSNLKAFRVSPENRQYKEIDGVLFTKDGKTLHSYPAGRKTSYTIPAGVTTIGEFAFSRCSSLVSITIPAGVTTISTSAFSACRSLTTVTIPNSVTTIDREAFRDCHNLVSVTIPDSVTSIGEGAFTYCYSLTNVTIPGSVTAIGKDAFSVNRSLISVTILSGVTSIGYYAFSGCTSLASVTIPDSVTAIDENAFRWCTSLTSVTIPASVTSIGEAAFDGCTDMKVISVAAANRQYKEIDGVLFTKDGKTLHSYPAGKGETAYTIPAGVTTIGDYAFSDCSSLVSVTIPAGVTTIGDYAFFGCSSLTSVTIPASVTVIGHWAFSRCENLKPEIRADIEKRFGKGVF